MAKNAPWQRAFGDWFQKNWSSHKQLATPLYTKIAKIFEQVIENHLAGSGKVAGMLRLADRPYFYASSKGLYYVPSAQEASDLAIKGIRYAEPDGTSQLFKVLIGPADSDSNQAAEIDVYLRYANGLWETNPTCRVQNVRNVQWLSWEKLA